MELWQALLLGIVQGLTEFLPISSSGHLVIVQRLFNLTLSPESVFSFDVAVHAGSLFALVYIYRIELVRLLRLPLRARRVEPSLPKEDDHRFMPINWYFVLLIILGTLPAVVVGLTLKDHIETLFASGQFLPYEFMATGVILLSSRWVSFSRFYKRSDAQITIWQAFAVGCSQALAILPAISRSGATIVVGMWLGIRADIAAHFSFFLAIPAILGAMVLALVDVSTLAIFAEAYIAVGFVASALVSGVCLLLLLKIIRIGRLYLFAYYCFFVAAVLFLLN